MRTKRQNNQLELAFGKECKGEALSGLVEGTEVCVARAGTERPAVFISLNPSNRHVRTRMRGDVGGVESRDSPLSRLFQPLDFPSVSSYLIVTFGGNNYGTESTW